MRKRVIVIGTILGALLLAAAWLLGWFSGNPAIAEVQQLQQKMADPNLKDADRQALRDQMRAKIEALSADARRAVFEAGREAFEKRFGSHVNQLLAMSAAERNKALDKDIDQMEKRAADFAKSQADGKAPPPGGKKGNRTAAVTDEQRLSRLRSRLDRGTPESRAIRAEYTRLIDDRLKQRGLSPMPTRFGR
jgi:hypothetical protein